MTPALDIRDVSVAFRGVPVLEDITLTLSSSDFVGIIGPNGAGKTVLLRTILGLVRPDRGSVRVFGKAPEDAGGEVAYVPQYARFDLDYPISVSDVVLMGRLSHKRFLRRYSGRDRDAVAAALERVGLGHLAAREVGRLSGGQLQRVLIARALAVQARLLLFDEPTASLDTRMVGEVYDLVADLARDHTVILVSHDIGMLPRYVRSVGCLNRTLHYHASKEITEEMIEAVYGCPVDLLVHKHTHKVVEEHS